MQKPIILSNKKNLTIFTGGLGAGGAEKQSILLAKALQKKYSVVLVSFHGNKFLKRNIDFLKSEGIEHFQLTGSYLARIRSFYSLLKTKKTNVLINFLPANNIVGGILGKLHGVDKIICGIRNSRLGRYKYLMLLFCHHILSHVTVFNNYAGLKYYAKRGFSTIKSTVITNCIFPLPSQKTSQLKNQKVVILMVARFVAQKDYFTAIDAFSLLLSEYKLANVVLECVGRGVQEKKIQQYLIMKGLENNVKIYIDPDNVNEHYERADVFLQTSLFEGFSNTIMEAMGYSLPIVATDVGDNSVLVKNNLNGFLTPTKDPKTISEKLYQLVTSSQLRQKMGENGCNMISESYTLESFSKSYIKIIEQ